MTKKTEEDWFKEFAEEHGREPDAQALHDWMTRDRRPVSPVSRKRLQKMLATKLAPLGFDPIASALADHPGRTREQAEADATAAGFSHGCRPRNGRGFAVLRAAG